MQMQYTTVMYVNAIDQWVFNFHSAYKKTRTHGSREKEERERYRPSEGLAVVKAMSSVAWGVGEVR